MHKKTQSDRFEHKKSTTEKEVSVIEIYCPGTPPSTKNGRRGQTQARPQPAQPSPNPGAQPRSPEMLQNFAMYKIVVFRAGACARTCKSLV